MAGQTLTLETLNGGNIVSDDGFTGSEDGWTLVLSGDDSGEITLNGEIKNAEIVSGIAKGNGLTGIADAAVTNIAGGNLIGNGTNSLAMNGGLVNIQSLGFERLQLKNLALNGGKLDIYNVNVDLENVKMGEMSAEEVSGDLALVEVKSLDVLSDGEAETTHVMFADNNIWRDRWLRKLPRAPVRFTIMTSNICPRTENLRLRGGNGKTNSIRKFWNPAWRLLRLSAC